LQKGGNRFRQPSREKASRGPAGSVPSVQSLGSLILFQPKPNAIQQIRVSGGFSFGDNPTAAFVRNNFSWSDDVSWVKGKHDSRFGGVIERSRVDLNNLFFQPAEFSFCNPTPGTGQTASQVLFNGFLAGTLCDYQGNLGFRQGAGEFKNNRGLFSGVYAQDNYKLSRRLPAPFPPSKKASLGKSASSRAPTSSPTWLSK